MSSFLANNQSWIVAVRPGGEGELYESHVKWKKDNRNIPEIPSILYYQDRLYSVRDGGIFTCWHPESGEVIYTIRIDKDPGFYTASPIAAKGKIYVTSVNGVISVIQAGDEFKLLQQNDLNEQINATPALHDDEIYVRSQMHLFAFAK